MFYYYCMNNNKYNHHNITYNLTNNDSEHRSCLHVEGSGHEHKWILFSGNPKYVNLWMYLTFSSLISLWTNQGRRKWNMIITSEIRIRSFIVTETYMQKGVVRSRIMSSRTGVSTHHNLNRNLLWIIAIVEVSSTVLMSTQRYIASSLRTNTKVCPMMFAGDDGSVLQITHGASQFERLFHVSLHVRKEIISGLDKSHLKSNK